MSEKTPVPTNSRKAIKYRSTECLNCGHPLELTDKYCSYCAQMNTTKNLSLKDFFGEFIGSIITYDSRFRYTLQDLLFKPGTITRNYVDGKRLRYANPFRFFLSVSIIYFLVQGLIATFTGGNTLIQDKSTDDKEEVSFGPTGDNIKFFTTLDKDSLDNSEAIFDLQGLDSVLSDNNIDLNRRELDSLLVNAEQNFTQEDVDSLVTEFKKLPFIGSDDVEYSYKPIAEATLDTMSWPERNLKRFKLYYDFYKTTEIENPVLALDSLGHRNTGYNRWAYTKNNSIERIERNPTEFFNYLLQKTPFFLFFFTPIFALFFWLIYSAKKYTYMEHMILIFHIFSFVFLAGIICMIPDTLLGDSWFFTFFLILIGPFYFYKALRNFYKQNRLLTIIKFIFLNWIFWIGASITALLFFAVTAALY